MKKIEYASDYVKKRLPQRGSGQSVTCNTFQKHIFISSAIHNAMDGLKVVFSNALANPLPFFCIISNY